jgi:hypothetical protein
MYIIKGGMDMRMKKVLFVFFAVALVAAACGIKETLDAAKRAPETAERVGKAANSALAGTQSSFKSIQESINAYSMEVTQSSLAPMAAAACPKVTLISESPNGCGKTSQAPCNQVYTLDFGSGCVEGSVTRSGVIKIESAKDTKTHAIIKVTFQKYADGEDPALDGLSTVDYTSTDNDAQGNVANLKSGSNSVNGTVTFTITGNGKLGTTGDATQVTATVTYTDLSVSAVKDGVTNTNTVNSVVTMASSTYEKGKLQTIQYVVTGIKGLNNAAWGTIKGTDGTDLQMKADGVKLDRGCEDAPIGGTINVKGKDSGGNFQPGMQRERGLCDHAGVRHGEGQLPVQEVAAGV